MENEKRSCRVPDCHFDAVKAVPVHLPATWDATPNRTTLTVMADCCPGHSQEVERRVADVLQARNDLYNLLTVVADALVADGEPHRVGGVA